jgi:succinate dehydrogenase / fumarate reductase cytochrome b subunit
MYTLEVKMSWPLRAFGSSIGKKLLMAITGLSFIGFLGAHLAGNLTLYKGGAAFNTYAEKLHALGPILTVFEFGLLALALIHVTTGIILFVQNLKARSVPYELDRPAGGRTLSSVTMPYTGFIILAFVIFHLITISFADKSQRTIFEIVSSAFASPVYYFQPDFWFWVRHTADLSMVYWVGCFSLDRLGFTFTTKRTKLHEN